MASLFPGYKYDIFISYRQKDNEYDGWVTEFVNNLKRELHATFKEEISVYFDANPQDGLLETHIVDESLSKKLRCLIFIPVISQTYCDPKSFAWQHEFCAFDELAKGDRFGRDIRLAGGDVASRILPVKIRDLDTEDKLLLENEIGGVLRSIEFIYKSAGVNRPLRANEDHPQDNLNKTYYRDQINKVANAIKEIINGLKHKEETQVEVLSEEQKPQPTSRTKEKVRWKNKKNVAVALTIVLTLFIGIWLLNRFVFREKEIEKSIAVLPFRNDTPVDSNKHFIDGIMEEALMNLQAIKDLRVLSRTSVEQYRSTTKSIPEIARELGVNYIVEGSGQKVGKNFRLRVQLIRAKGKEDHIWAKSFEQEIQNPDNVFIIQSEIAQEIAKELQASITPEEKLLIDKIPTSNLDALYSYQRGKEELSKYTPLSTNRLNTQIQINNRQALGRAYRHFNKALEYDTTFALAYTGIARIFQTVNYKPDTALFLCGKALSYDKQLFEAHILRGNYYIWINPIRAAEEYDMAIRINPNSWEACYRKGLLYMTVNNYDLIKAFENLQKAASVNRGSELADIKYDIARAYRHAGFYEKSKEVALEVLRLDGDSIRYFSHIAAAENYLGNYEKAYELEKKAYTIDSTNIRIWQNLAETYTTMDNWEESLKWWKKCVESGQTASQNYFNLGLAYLKNGYKKEAEDIFNEIIKSNENWIKSNPQAYIGYYELARIYAIKGDKEKAYESLRHFSQIQKFASYELAHLRSKSFDKISSEPEFKEIANEMEAKFQVIHERVRKWLEENNML